MSVEISFPIEFIVSGIPVSLQASSQSREAWKARIRKACYAVLPEGHFLADGDRFAVTILHFPTTPMEGDIDNIVKPILDALSRHIYADDHLVERIWVQRVDPGVVASFRAPSPTLLIALSASEPITYIRVSDDPQEGLL